jgi:hypothetical protein
MSMMRSILPGIGFALVVLGTAVALLLGMPAMLALVLIIVAVCGYGLLMHRQRMVFVEPTQQQTIVRTHLRQFGFVVVVSLMLGSIAIFLPARPGFAGLLVLALLVAVGLGQMVRGLTKQ